MESKGNYGLHMNGGFIQQGRHSIHKDKTVTTNAFKQTMDARQDALTR